jgi:hypothetical protein
VERYLRTLGDAHSSYRSKVWEPGDSFCDNFPQLCLKGESHACKVAPSSEPILDLSRCGSIHESFRCCLPSAVGCLQIAFPSHTVPTALSLILSDTCCELQDIAANLTIERIRWHDLLGYRLGASIRVRMPQRRHSPDQMMQTRQRINAS